MTTSIDGTSGVTFPAGGVGNPASAVVGLTDTQTLTNKSIVASQLTGTQTIPKGTLPTGSVLQVVNVNNSTAYSSSSSTPVATGFSASITPLFSTSKVLVLSNIRTRKNSSGSSTSLMLQLYRGSTQILILTQGVGYNNGTAPNDGMASASYLDSPATTSSVTYTWWLGSYANVASVSINPDGSPADTSTIVLMEIAA